MINSLSLIIYKVSTTYILVLEVFQSNPCSVSNITLSVFVLNEDYIPIKTRLLSLPAWLELRAKQ